MQHSAKNQQKEHTKSMLTLQMYISSTRRNMNSYCFNLNSTNSKNIDTSITEVHNNAQHSSLYRHIHQHTCVRQQCSMIITDVILP